METILIASDFSPAADNALEYGARLARHFNASVLLAHAYSLPLYGFDVRDPLTIIGELGTIAHQKLAEAKKMLSAKYGLNDIRCVEEPGRPLDVIRILCDRYDVDLVVVGIVGSSSAVKRHVIGSTALGLSDHKGAPVIIVPEHTHYKPVNNIALAWDRSLDENPALLQMTRAIAAEFGAKLEVITASEEVNEPAGLSHYDAGFEKVVIPAKGNAARALENYFREHTPDMIMVCARQHGIMQRFFREGVTAKLAYSLEVPVMVVRG